MYIYIYIIVLSYIHVCIGTGNFAVTELWHKLARFNSKGVFPWNGPALGIVLWMRRARMTWAFMSCWNELSD